MVDEGDDSDEITPWIDSLDRFEREIDHQVDALNAIDDKAQYTARIIAILLGLVLTSLSLASRQAILTDAALATVVSLAIGIAGLIAALIGSVVAYLSSQYETGLDYRAADGLAMYSVTPEQYQDLILGAYASALQLNKNVVLVNANRFRKALTALLIGIIFLSVAGFLIGVDVGPDIRWGLVLLAGLVSAGIIWYIPTNRYLAIEDEELINE